MELIIGRDHATNKLKVIKGNQQIVFSEMPMMGFDISESHCKITQINENDFVVTALKGVTSVNGLEVVSKQIKLTDEIKLGNSGFVLPLNQVLKELESAYVSGTDKAYDISHLKAVWDKYHDGMINIQVRQKNNNLLYRIPMVFTMLCGLMSFNDQLRPYTLIPTVIAFIIMLFGIYRAVTDKSIKKKELLKREFLRNYVCPACKQYLGFQDYELTIHNLPQCTKCKAKFKHE